MFKFFRKIRYDLLKRDKTGRYLKYALGEIVLVVIGILIALTINNWNNDRITRNKEKAYLQEIIINLKKDSLALEEVVLFNASKVKVVENMMKIFTDTLTNEERFQLFVENSDNFVYYRVFEPTSTAFNNMVSAESIDLVSNPALKALLTEYYSYDYLGGSQERIIYMNRKVVDRAFPIFFTREFVQERLGLSTKMPKVADLTIVNDQILLSDLYGIMYLIQIQNDLMRETMEKNTQITDLISEML